MTDIDYNQLHCLTGRQLIRALERDVFILRRQVGSHRDYKNADGRRVTVAIHHTSDTFRPKTLRSMTEMQAHWKWEDLKRLQLISCGK